jgi:outer membrane receptor protein involved in Fe transport
MQTTQHFLGYPIVLRLIFPLLLGTATLGAQSIASVPPPARASLAATAAEDVIELSPFSVSSSKDVGYLAQNTLAGSRLNSSLKDTPGVLDVLTKEFLDDIGATTLEQALAFSANFAEDNGDFDSQGVINTVFPGSQAGVSFRTRGLGGTVARNYLETDFRPTFYTVERIDNSSGPNSILFGLGSAGGVANISTKTAKLYRHSYGLDFHTDSYSSRRVALDVNQVLIPQTLGLRVNALAHRGKKYRANFTDNTDGVQLSTRWRVNDRTEVRVEYEREKSSGSVAYPGPHLEQVSTWIARGAQVVSLPANWESLTAAARTAFATPVGLSVAGTGVAPVVVQNGAQSYIINSANHLTTSTTVGGTNRQSIDPAFFTPRGNINGPGGRKGVARQILAVAVDHKLRENLYLNLSAARESGDADTYQAFANGAAAGAVIQVDANGMIPNAAQITKLGTASLTTNAAGQVLNPFAGQYYTQTRWLHRTQHNEREVVQATVAYQLDLGRWFGSHRMMGTTSYTERVIGSESFRDSWIGAPFNNDPVNTNNGVTRRRYASPLDADYFHVPDWRDFPVLTWNHPTRGPLTTGWITEGESLRHARQFAYLTALQSYFFKRRLVVTAGYRVDEAIDYVYARKRIFPVGYETSAGINVLDPTAVAKSSSRGPTRTIGGVFHLTDWLSAYANRSTNFGSPRGTVVGPDGLIGPTTKGLGLDTGLKFNLFANQVSLDVGYFDTSSNNVTEVLNLNLRTADSIGGAYNAVFSALSNPAGTVRLFNPADAAAVTALRDAYSFLRPTFNAQGDLLDQASRGYEVRLTANPMKGMRLRATYSKTQRERENLYQLTLPTAAQLRTYIGELQKKNPGITVGALYSATDASRTTIAESLNNLDERLDLTADNNSSNFGAGKGSFNLVASYDFQRYLKGVGVTLTTVYRSGAYTGTYEVREGGAATGQLLATQPLFGQSTTDFGLGVRYRTKFTWLRQTGVTWQLNVSNLLDETEPLVRRANRSIIAPGGTPPTVATSTVGSYFLRNPRAWNLSAKFDF